MKSAISLMNESRSVLLIEICRRKKRGERDDNAISRFMRFSTENSLNMFHATLHYFEEFSISRGKGKIRREGACEKSFKHEIGESVRRARLRETSSAVNLFINPFGELD